jgi:serine/threonine-protein kinase
MYMRAHALWDERNLPALREAADLYQKAIAEDPKFALAYSDLAGVERTLLQFNFAPRAQLLESAKSHALQAVAAGPGYAESYAALAVTNQYAWEWRAADVNYKRAIEINPKLAYVHRWYGGLLVGLGKFDEGIRETQTSAALDPYDLVGHIFLGTYLYYAGRPAEAAALVEGLLAQRDLTVGHNILGYVYAQLALRASGSERIRLLDRALKETDIVAKEDATYQKPAYAGVSAPMYALFYALRGDREQAVKYLNLLLPGEKAGAVNPVDIACSYVALGDPTAALDVLKRGMEARDSGLLYMKVDPFLEPLRGTAEFKALIKQAGLN